MEGIINLKSNGHDNGNLLEWLEDSLDIDTIYGTDDGEFIRNENINVQIYGESGDDSIKNHGGYYVTIIGATEITLFIVMAVIFSQIPETVQTVSKICEMTFLLIRATGKILFSIKAIMSLLAAMLIKNIS